MGPLLSSRGQPEGAPIRARDRPPAICLWPHERLPADGGAAGSATVRASHRPWAGSLWHAASPPRRPGTTSPRSVHRSAPAARPEHSPRVRSEREVVGRLGSDGRDPASTARSRHWIGIQRHASPRLSRGPDHPPGSSPSRQRDNGWGGQDPVGLIVIYVGSIGCCNVPLSAFLAQ